MIAIDQYGHIEYGLKHPRKDLLKRVGRTRANKMYVDTTQGKTLHVGYVIGPHWFRLYKEFACPEQ